MDAEARGSDLSRVSVFGLLPSVLACFVLGRREVGVTPSVWKMPQFRCTVPTRIAVWRGPVKRLIGLKTGVG